ncbi:MAG: prepilin peptidase [Nanoarchaeota archaeon]
MIINNENLFLILLAVVWIIGAILQDIKRREVDNIWNFSLIAFALAYRFSLSIFNGNYMFFLNGIVGLIIFLFLGNLFYYGRLFAGGDAKLLIALGSILPLSYEWIINFKIFLVFISGFLFGGSIYVFLWSIVLVFLNFEKFSREYKKQSMSYKNYFIYSFIFVLILSFLFYFINKILIFSALVFLLFPFLFIFARAIEEVCMIKKVSVDKLTVGDWLYEDLYVKGKKIEKNWEGLSYEDLKLIQKKYNRKVLVKYGIPFTPSFLIGFFLILYLSSKGIFL